MKRRKIIKSNYSMRKKLKKKTLAKTKSKNRLFFIQNNVTLN
jgi:hypothetical protein